MFIRSQTLWRTCMVGLLALSVLTALCRPAGESRLLAAVTDRHTGLGRRLAQHGCPGETHAY